MSNEHGNGHLMFGATMYKLGNNPILYPHQKKLLSLFFSSPFSKTFFLTGGTALSAFYLAHRESQDLDFFSLDPFDTLALRTTMQEITTQLKAELTIHIRSQTYNELFLENKKEGWIQKIDIVQEQPKHFGEIKMIKNIRIDSLINIATNKILAVLGRLEAKDFIDLYIICTQTELSFDEIFKLAKQKDSGLSEFYFANTIADVDKLQTLPRMKIAFGKRSFIKFYKDLSHELLLKIKPAAP